MITWLKTKLLAVLALAELPFLIAASVFVAHLAEQLADSSWVLGEPIAAILAVFAKFISDQLKAES